MPCNSGCSCGSVSGLESSVEESSRSGLLRLAVRKHAKLAESAPLKPLFYDLFNFSIKQVRKSILLDVQGLVGLPGLP
jgi:hypothetical protein